MNKVTVYNQAGTKVKDLELNPAIFGLEVKPDIIQHAVVVQQANARKNLAHVKDRSDVSGGGKKPWKQKGTGRARHGSSRSPIWRGGGITFGPRNNQNYSLKINKKLKQQAILMGLSDKAAHESIIFVDSLSIGEAKTKKIFEILQNLKLRRKSAKDGKEITGRSSVLVVLPKKDEALRRAAKNINRVETILADSLNIVDVVKNQQLLIPVEAIEVIEKTFAKGIKSGKPKNEKKEVKKTVKKAAPKKVASKSTK